MAEIEPHVFKTIRRIQIISTQLANDILAGAYRSAFKGRGMEFEEVREYQPGDEVRSIDWNVTARMSHPYVKNFREERDITVILVVDVSASSRFGGRQATKSELIAEIGALLAFSAIKNNDKVGLLLFSNIVEKYIPPRKGTRHVLRLIRELLVFQPEQRGSDLKMALSFLGKVLTRSGICFLISDFFCGEYAHEISLMAKRHDLISICVSDPYEHDFPNIGLANLTDLETEETAVIDTAFPPLQEHFKKAVEKRFAYHRDLMKRIGAGFINIGTDQSYLPAIHKFFRLREARRR